MERKCSKCKEEKALDLFVKDKACQQGRKTICKECYSTINREWRANNILKNRECQKNYRIKKKAQAAVDCKLKNL
jgi:hypothetical protein